MFVEYFISRQDDDIKVDFQWDRWKRENMSLEETGSCFPDLNLYNLGRQIADEYPLEIYKSENEYFNIVFLDASETCIEIQAYLSVDELSEIFNTTLINKILESDKEHMRLEDLLEHPCSVDMPDNELDECVKNIFRVEEYEPGDKGYILKDGTFIKLNEHLEIHHKYIHWIPGMTCGEFISRGNIRIGEDFFELEKYPTPPQKRILRNLIRETPYTEVYVDIVKFNPESRSWMGDNICSGTYHTHNCRVVLGQIDRFFAEGIKLDENWFPRS